MEEFIDKVRFQFQKIWNRYGRRLAVPGSVRRWFYRVITYFRNHPRVRYATYGLSAACLLLVSFVCFILTQTPSKKQLTTIKNAVASEVYSADSVLLGRYYI